MVELVFARGSAPRQTRERMHSLGACTLLSLWLPLAPACGPSIQSIHEGSVRFEHCYRLDFDVRIAPSHRHACWEQWTRVYSYGQARDRVEHARRRLTELEAGDPEPPNLNLDETESGREREFYMSMPTHMDAHTPPPPVATAPVEEVPKQVVPGDECMIRCRQQRGSCLSACPAGSQPGKVDDKSPEKAPPEPQAEADKPKESEGEAPETQCTCEADYKTCATRCFE